MYQQEIEQAFVCYGQDYRIYVPYKGKLTKKVKSKIAESVKKYLEHQKLQSCSLGWATKNVVLFRENNTVNCRYQEDGASGRTDCYVCNLDFADFN